MKRENNIAKWCCRIVGMLGVSGAAFPHIIDGSVGWSLAAAVASIVAYYAGAATVVAGTVSIDE